MAPATAPRPGHGSKGDALRDKITENQEEKLTPILNENAKTESDVESETKDRSIRDSNDTHASAYSDLNNKVRINRNASESDTSNITTVNNATENASPSSVGNEGVTDDSRQWFSGSEDGDSGRSQRKSYRDSAEALELALMQLGPFGLYQRYVVLMLCIPNMLAAMYSLNYVFVADQVPFRCVVPECEGAGSHFGNATVQALLAAERCRRYAPLREGRPSCARADFHLNDTVTCDAVMYENMDTIYAEFDLACAEWRRTLVGTLRNAALPFALLLTGYISDGWGRRTAFCSLSFCAGALGIVKSLMPHYRAYLALEFLEAALGYGFTSAAYVMMVELARPSLRVAFASATGVGYGLGGVVFALLARRVRCWRVLLRVVHAPALLLPLYWLLLHESARWLHVRGRRRQLVRNIRKAAHWNKVTIDEDLLAAIEEDQKSEEVEPKSNPWLSLMKSRVLMLRFGVCCWCWVAVSFVYYGLTINSVALAGDKYTNFALNMAMEIVASLLIMMALERFGRKRSIFAAFLVCGIACIIPYFVSHSGTGLGTFFVGKLAITFAFNSLYVFTAELFPTDARSSALGAASLVGRLGSVLAPQTPLLILSSG
ncbi:organic cation transporter protein-like isoform X2 [Maniola jurtina]|uniref:organic cation transporter protein-like isoform X2 n=1 Tax=Maniola jurtina TaxID=191418 RepID=UPI001E68EBC6|nr:organic cation transporter protein-like isoform X2 [Maniola jurtina]XP_045769545.1 organic cation transporter protein-like isoform X2 [Maniola jurtina]